MFGSLRARLGHAMYRRFSYFVVANAHDMSGQMLCCDCHHYDAAILRPGDSTVPCDRGPPQLMSSSVRPGHTCEDRHKDQMTASGYAHTGPTRAERCSVQCLEHFVVALVDPLHRGSASAFVVALADGVHLRPQQHTGRPHRHATQVRHGVSHARLIICHRGLLCSRRLCDRHRESRELLI